MSTRISVADVDGQQLSGDALDRAIRELDSYLREHGVAAARATEPGADGTKSGAATISELIVSGVFSDATVAAVSAAVLAYIRAKRRTVTVQKGDARMVIRGADDADRQLVRDFLLDPHDND